MPHTTTLKVRFYELDPYDHVNHSAYVQYFESARVELLDEVGIGLRELKHMGFHLVVTELAARFLRPAGGGDELRIETEVIDIRRASSRWAQRMYRGDELIASQEIVAATTSVEGRPVRFPEAMADRLRPYLVGGV